MSPVASAPQPRSISLSELADTCSIIGTDLEMLGRRRRGWVILQTGIFFERLIAVEQKLRGWLAAARDKADQVDRRTCAVPGAIARTDRHAPPTLGDMALACSDAGLFYEIAGGRPEMIRMGTLLRKAAIFLDRLHPIMGNIRRSLSPIKKAAYEAKRGSDGAP